MMFRCSAQEIVERSAKMREFPYFDGGTKKTHRIRGTNKEAVTNIPRMKTGTSNCSIFQEEIENLKSTAAFLIEIEIT
jgi:hypothetical protein